jgi:GNAT superfamily N-acetyltransferase
MIDIATPFDVEKTIELGLRMPAESGFNMPEGLADKAQGVLLEAMKSHPTFVYKVDGEIVGVLALTESSVWWSDTNILIELFFYVEKDKRNKGAATALLKEAQRYAEDVVNMPLIVELFTRTDLDKKVKFLGRLGYKRLGVTMGVNI